MPALRPQKGQIELMLLLIIILIFSYFIVGGLFPNKKANTPLAQTVAVTTNACCENATCEPSQLPNESFVLNQNNQKYGLLKRNIKFVEQNVWLKWSGQDFNGTGSEGPIVLNVSDVEFNWCGPDGMDQLFVGTNCTPIPNDLIVYVCRDKCTPTDYNTSHCQLFARYFGNGICYGQADAVYDAYYRIVDYNQNGMIPSIMSCAAGNTTVNVPQTKQIVVPPVDEPAGSNLHLRKLEIVTVPIPVAQDSFPWLSPECKPAIYLYPEEKTNVNVKVTPMGKLTHTIPNYSPSLGWQVTAFPNGIIHDKNKTYDYLYYETQIPNSLIEKPIKGFVVKHSELADLFDHLLPRLGLNEKEARQFSEYWLAALPNYPYYFVGIMPLDNLNEISPVAINPSPDTFIRVTLYFEALEEKIEVAAPLIDSIKREGFTAVEWGGIVKTDPNHPFSCLM